MDDSIPFASREYFILLGLLAFARAADFFSTWIATPHLALEGNPLAKWLGWKWGVALNVILIPMLARWPFVAIAFSTTSLLVAARNFQSAWLMRSMGEAAYGDWHVRRICEAPFGLMFGCLAGNVFLFALPGAALFLYGGEQLIPTAIGLGVLVYSLAVAVFVSLSYWRIRRRRAVEISSALEKSALN